MQDAAHIDAHLRRRAARASCRCPGAKEVGVEVHSLSKGFNMIGWRIGWVCGHERIVQAFADVKDNSDSGQFIAIQKAAAAALDDPTIPVRTREKYQRRLREAGRRAPPLRLRLRDARRHLLPLRAGPEGRSRTAGPSRTAEAASQYLITEHSICTVPWDDAGPYLRFSVTYEAADERPRTP